MTWITALAGGFWLLYVAMTVRSARHTTRVVAQWGDDAVVGWRSGKLKIVLGVLVIFLATQPVVLLPAAWRALLVLGCLGFLVWGEYEMGSAFRNVADAQDRWHAGFEEKD